MTLQDKLRIAAKLHQTYRQSIGTEIISVVDQSSLIEVEIDGLITKFTPVAIPKDFVGIAKFETMDSGEAKFLRAADEIEKIQYMTLFPSVRMIVIKVMENSCLAIQENLSHKVVIEGVAEIKFVNSFVERFTTILTRFDGKNIIFESQALSSNDVLEYLKKSFAEERIEHNRYLPPRHKLAYEIAIRDIIEQKRREHEERRRLEAQTIEGKLRQSVEYLGGDFESYQDIDGEYLIRYRIDNHEFSSRVRKDNLRTIASGICLSGRDGDFDLTTLVGVMRKSISEDIDDSDW